MVASAARGISSYSRLLCRLVCAVLLRRAARGYVSIYRPVLRDLCDGTLSACHCFTGGERCRYRCRKTAAIEHHHRDFVAARECSLWVFGFLFRVAGRTAS